MATAQCIVETANYSFLKHSFCNTIPPKHEFVGRSIWWDGFRNSLRAPPLRATPINGWATWEQPIVAWDGADFRNEEQYTYVLTTGEIHEIEAALENLGLDGQDIRCDNFPLPSLAGRLFELAKELHFGRGFFALRGLDPAKYSQEDNVLIFLGISSYIGDKRGIQDVKGHLFGHIREAKAMEATQSERPIRDSNLTSAFHTDLFCDILAMQTRGLPASGGSHMVASTAKIYMELLKTRPHLIPVLLAPNWPFDTRGQLSPPSTRPLLYHHGGRLIMSFIPDALTGGPGIARPPSLPRLTPLQVEALAAVQELAARHARHLHMQLGDLTYVNNLTLLHAREGFVDSHPTRVRYLVRMWLKNTDMALELPPQLAAGNRRLFGADNEELGIREDWNIAYEPRLTFEVAERLTP
ncbi:hypothetical protein BX600DRAFT_506272 [Xylariales sp. PMI_506]|nr:hypothetical protein BX600DRAFT_506272 [Xylariales sp. PMI_506]